MNTVTIAHSLREVGLNCESSTSKLITSDATNYQANIMNKPKFPTKSDRILIIIISVMLVIILAFVVK